MHLGNQPSGHYTEWPCWGVVLYTNCSFGTWPYSWPFFRSRWPLRGAPLYAYISRSNSACFVGVTVNIIIHILVLNPCSKNICSGPLGNWSDFGCRLRSFNTLNQTVTCECDHLTNFAVLLVSVVRVNQKLKSICVEFGPRSFML